MVAAKAAAACNEFAEIMAMRGEETIAALFRELAAAERLRAAQEIDRAASLSLPPLPSGQYGWLYGAPPGRDAHGLVAHLLTPHAALRIALNAEVQARVLFEDIAAAAFSRELQAQALALAAEKSLHILWLAEALARTPEPFACRDDFDGLWPAAREE